VYLTAQRVISTGGESGINGFLYEHAVTRWGTTPPELIDGAIGELVHTFILVPPGDNKVVSYVDIVAPDGTTYDRIRAQIVPWMATQARERPSLPWTGVVEDMRFGLHMTETYAKAWKPEVAKLLLTCQMTLDRYTLPAPAESRP
jgi:hypothetical protein